VRRGAAFEGVAGLRRDLGQSAEIFVQHILIIIAAIFMTRNLAGPSAAVSEFLDCAGLPMRLSIKFYLISLFCLTA
jgi:hypothetical protein